MNNEQEPNDTQDNSLAHVINEKKDNEPKSYDPDRYLPDSSDGKRYEPEVPLEDKDPSEGYSTDPAQGKQEASLHLADEDMDRRLEDPKEEAENLKESYEMSKQNDANS